MKNRPSIVLGRYIGALALVIIGGVNLFSIKKWGRTGTAILASKVVTRTRLGRLGLNRSTTFQERL